MKRKIITILFCVAVLFAIAFFCAWKELYKGKPETTIITTCPQCGGMAAFVDEVIKCFSCGNEIPLGRFKGIEALEEE